MSKFISMTGVPVNDPDICIRNYGSTFACVCKECTEEYRSHLDALAEMLKNLPEDTDEPREVVVQKTWLQTLVHKIFK